MQEGQYLYCIIGTGEARNFGPIGIGGRGDPVTTIAYRDLSTVVSSVPMSKYVVSKEIMLDHEKVIEAVMKDYTVLPVPIAGKNCLPGRRLHFGSRRKFQAIFGGSFK